MLREKLLFSIIKKKKNSFEVLSKCACEIKNVWQYQIAYMYYSYIENRIKHFFIHSL